MKHDLIGLRDVQASDIVALLARIDDYHAHRVQTHPCAGAFVANLFFENSTRTRCSFEIAQRRLGMHVLNFSPSASSMQKGETITDTVKTFVAMGIDVAVLRMKPEGLLVPLAKDVPIPIINAGDGNHEHPTQALLDLYTMHKQFGAIRGLTVAIIGDIKHSRVARSNVWALKKLGAHVVFCAPPQMHASDIDVPYVPIDDALHADVVMVLRVQLERHEGVVWGSREAYRAAYGLTAERLERMQPHAILMHPAPVNRNVEIDDACVEHPRSRIFQQMAHGVPTRMAVLEWALTK
ncbi:MAG: aspartate carbamoyltransferase catalytic subunit [Paenibacillaceae bacterium]|jgi:aspartate carbamoyltransferase catalytic subunit|nr:aspartate carbamoyltransferase catalytic subunit [Paenibacillaceae bacterium]